MAQAAFNFIEAKYLRSDFKPELTRILSAIRDCEMLDKMLDGFIKSFTIESRQHPGTAMIGRGAGGMVVRLTEQIISNRAQRLALVSKLHSIKKDVIDRDYRLAKATVDTEVVKETAATAALLKMLQVHLMLQQPSAFTLEPFAGSDLDDAADSRIGSIVGESSSETGEAGEAWPDGLPEDYSEGDTVCDAEGSLWIVGPEGAESADSRAEVVFLEPPDGTPPYARLEDGRLVLVFDISAGE
jgi:hypothetical protein